MKIIIKLKEVYQGETKNWLVFRGFIPRYDVNQLFIFKFCGTELETTASLPNELHEQLRIKFSKKFGYPPFINLSEIEDKLKSEEYHTIEIED